MIIVLADGTRLTDVSMNGDNYTTVDIVEDSLFANNLSPVTIIDDDGNETVHEHMKLLGNMVYQGQSMFVLEDIDPKVFVQMKMRGDIEYIAMMSDIKLD